MSTGVWVLLVALAMGLPASWLAAGGGLVGGYYLTGLDEGKVSWHHWRVLVLEPDEASPQVIEAARRHARLVLAYVNVGYAEDWRSYWPSIAGASWVHGSAGYEGEYLVEYWRPEWHGIVASLAREYVGRGFDGVYLDNVDAVDRVAGEEWAMGVDPEAEMIHLICNVSIMVKTLDPDARVFVNIGGATRLLYNDTLLSCIDGVLREELWVEWTPGGPRAQDPAEIAMALEALEHALSHGKTVLVADPAQSPGEAWLHCLRSWLHGFIPVPQPSWAWDYSMPPPPTWCPAP